VARLTNLPSSWEMSGLGVGDLARETNHLTAKHVMLVTQGRTHQFTGYFNGGLGPVAPATAPR
jgi:hypothetical protein